MALRRARQANQALQLPELVTQLAVALLVTLLLIAVGQPIFSDDTWIHLALGRSYLSEGLWLSADPLLFTAPGPPVPAAWLFDLGLYELSDLLGLQALRILHVSLVAALLALGWSVLRRASGSALIASLGIALFAVLAAYRLVQLRPHLFSILFALGIYRLVLEGEHTPSKLRCAVAILLMWIWANMHAAFLLGPLIVAAAATGVLLDAFTSVPQGPERGVRRERGLRLIAVATLGFAATFANPALAEGHLAWFVSGSQTPSLHRVADEWLPLDLFRLPGSGLPPAPLSWLLYWALLVVTCFAACRELLTWRSGRAKNADPALLLLGVGTLVAPLVAVRFLWLTIFPILLVASVVRAPERLSARWALACVGWALIPGFWLQGPWAMISNGLSAGPAGYARSYPASKYYGHAIWFLEDANLEGHLFNDYFLGGFAGYWLAPEIKTFASGTLNLSLDAMESYLPIRTRAGIPESASFEELLDRHEVDLFLGTGVPEVGNPNRPWYYTTSHLERTPGWIPVFRNLRSAVYVRDNERNAENLQRVARYYAREGVPFDPNTGFDPLSVAQQNPRWAIQRGLVPVNYRQTLRAERSADPAVRATALSYLAAWHGALGAYERAAELDAELLELRPRAEGAQRRRVWSLLRSGELETAAGESSALAHAEHALARRIAREAAELREEPAADEQRARIARLPVFTRGEAKRLLEGFSGPEAR